jgi:hypothetical protein
LPWFGPVLIPLLCFPVIYQGGYSSFPVNLWYLSQSFLSAS